jgi:NmrA-like family
MPLLVTGATGRTSAGVVRHLRAAGEDVRVLVRDSDKAKQTFEDQDGIEIVAGAFDDETVLAQAFDGADVAFLALGSSPDQIRLENAMIDGAVTAELPHLVKLSSMATSHDSALLVGGCTPRSRTTSSRRGWPTRCYAPPASPTICSTQPSQWQWRTAGPAPRLPAGWPTSTSATCPRRPP